MYLKFPRYCMKHGGNRTSSTLSSVCGKVDLPYEKFCLVVQSMTLHCIPFPWPVKVSGIGLVFLYLTGLSVEHKLDYPVITVPKQHDVGKVFEVYNKCLV